MSGPIVRSYYSTPPARSHIAGRVELRITEPPGLLTRSRVPALDASMARFIARDGDDLLLRATTAPAPIIHDFGSIRGYDSTARQILTAWGKALGPR